MKIIVDVNVLLSALIRDSTTRKIILQSDFDFYFPEPSMHKIRKYEAYILQKSGLSEKEYNILVARLFRYITLVPVEKVKSSWSDAVQVMGRIDEEDVVFIAVAMLVDDSIIWSDDKDFDRQKRIKVLKTADMVKFVNSN